MSDLRSAMGWGERARVKRMAFAGRRRLFGNGSLRFGRDDRKGTEWPRWGTMRREGGREGLRARAAHGAEGVR